MAGIPIPAGTRQGITRFLQSVSSGRHGGLAAYRPHEGPTRTMTAEALVCWQFLGLQRRTRPATRPANIWGQLPGDGRAESLLLVLRHAGHVSVAGPLLAAVERGPPRTVAYQPASRWSAGRLLGPRCPVGRLRRPHLQHGSLSALCLEVYYRYLPLYAYRR